MHPAVTKNWDVFISYAAEDRVTVAEPLQTALRRTGLRVWLDVHALQPSDSIRASIDAALASTRLCIVILSHAYFGKRWTLNELNAAFSLEAAGRTMILPVWHGVDDKAVAQNSPLLADRVGIATTNPIQLIAACVADTLERSDVELTPSTVTAQLQALITTQRAPIELARFLLRNYQIVSRAMAANIELISGRACVDDVLVDDDEDFIVGVTLPRTEPVSCVGAYFFVPPAAAILDDAATPTQAFARTLLIARQYLSSCQSPSAFHRLWEIPRINAARSVAPYRLAAPILIAARRRDLKSYELDYVGETNRNRSYRIRTYDWLLDAARSVDLGFF